MASGDPETAKWAFGALKDLTNVDPIQRDLYNKLHTLAVENDAMHNEMADCNRNMQNTHVMMTMLKETVENLQVALRGKSEREEYIKKLEERLQKLESGVANRNREEATRLTELRTELEERLQELEGEVTNLNQKLACVGSTRTQRTDGNVGRSHMGNPLERNLINFEEPSLAPWQVKTEANTQTAEPHQQRTRMEVRDIDQLTFSDVKSLHAPAVIHEFCQQVMQVGITEEDRISIAKTRMERRLRLYMGGEIETHNIKRFEDLRHLLLTGFERAHNADEAVQELYDYRYTIDMDPKEYVNDFREKYRGIHRAFPNEEIPEEERIWKSLILAGLPREFQIRLQAYAGEGMEQKFLLELEKARSLKRWGRVANVTEQVAPGTNPTPGTQRQYPDRPCGWCQDGSKHHRRECPRRPQAHSCFDCLQPNERRGHAGCPGFTGPRQPVERQEQ